MLVVQASNIHIGGGAVLLNELLKFLVEAEIPAMVYVDQRYVSSLTDFKNVKLMYVKPNGWDRLCVEWLLFKQSKKSKEDYFLFFGNLPPLFRLSGRATLFFQNMILLETATRFRFSFFVELKHRIEKFWLRLNLRHVERVIVQTESVKRKFLQQYPLTSVEVLAFTDMQKNKSQTQPLGSIEKAQNFLYVASAESHKNHLNLLKAWKILAEQKLLFTLTLTAELQDSECQNLLREIQVLGGHVVQKTSLSRAQVVELFKQTDALIFPSFLESLGLPLLEAQALNVPILAPELDYVRDVVEPQQTFDPTSSLSIARAVLRFVQKASVYKSEPKTARDFFELILK